MIVPIISCKVLENKTYRLCVTLGSGMLENVVVTSDGLYSVYYIRDGKSINHTGRILNIVQNCAVPKNNYILFDWSEDNSNRKERIMFYQIQYIKDVTPNDAYQIALKHGFVGTVDDWLESMRGLPGKNAYELAVDCGFEGTLEEWLDSLHGSCEGSGKDGLSAYEIAVRNGFKGSEQEWLESLKGRPGMNGLSAYQIAIQYGFNGTEEDWLRSLKGKDGLSAYEIAVKEYGFTGTQDDWMAANGDVTALNIEVSAIKNHISWKNYMSRP